MTILILTIVRFFTVTGQCLATPKQVRTSRHASTLIWFLKQFAGRQSALCAQRLRILLRETTDLFQRPHNQCNGGQLCLRVRNLIFVQRKGLRHKLVRDSFVIIEAYLVDGEGALKVKSQRQIGQFRLHKRRNCGMTELKDFLAFFLPLVVFHIAVFVGQLVCLEYQRRQGVFYP